MVMTLNKLLFPACPSREFLQGQGNITLSPTDQARLHLDVSPDPERS